MPMAIVGRRVTLTLMRTPTVISRRMRARLMVSLLICITLSTRVATLSILMLRMVRNRSDREDCERVSCKDLPGLPWARECRNSSHDLHDSRRSLAVFFGIRFTKVITQASCAGNWIWLWITLLSGEAFSVITTHKDWLVSTSFLLLERAFIHYLLVNRDTMIGNEIEVALQKWYVLIRRSQVYGFVSGAFFVTWIWHTHTHKCP